MSKPKRADSQLSIVGTASEAASPTEWEHDAALSDCGTYRWWLSRMRRGAQGPIGLICMVNPSVGDASRDDATIHSLKRRSHHWQWRGFYIVNLFAYRSSHPTDLLVAEDPLGWGTGTVITECDEHIVRLASDVTADGGPIVVAWGGSVDFRDAGTRPEIRGRDERVLRVLTGIADVYCLGRTSSGAPTHPGARGAHRVPDDAPLVLYAPAAATVAASAEAPVRRAEKASPPPFSPEHPPDPADMPREGSAVRGTCAGCGAPSEGRYDVGGAVPVCNLCGVSQRPPLCEALALVSMAPTVRRHVEPVTDAPSQILADWDAVAEECPCHASADSHRIPANGIARVHVVQVEIDDACRIASRRIMCLPGIEADGHYLPADYRSGWQRATEAYLLAELGGRIL